MNKPPFLSVRLSVLLGLLPGMAEVARGQISYATPGGLYTENFDSLPKDAPSNANLEGVYTNGWQDNSTTVQGDHIGVPGWYLYHPITIIAGEGGTNGNQRFRIGAGSNVGSFWGFGTTAVAADMALGSIGSATVADNDADMYMALRLANNTGAVLTSFTLTYDGEAWRDGASNAGETLVFEYSLSAGAGDWFSTATFTPVPALNFSNPAFSGTGGGGAQVDGNSTGLTANISETVTAISWAPGAELWLRWADNSLPTLADDGLAIDNVRFSAVPEPAGLSLLGLGAAGLLLRRRRREPGR